MSEPREIDLQPSRNYATGFVVPAVILTILATLAAFTSPFVEGQDGMMAKAQAHGVPADGAGHAR